MKILFSILALPLCLTLTIHQTSDEAKIKELVTTFIEATDVQDADRMGSTLHDQAMQYVRFGKQLFTFSKAQYVEQLKDKKLGGHPREIKFGELLAHGTRLTTLSLTATSSELKFHYLFSLLLTEDGWVITSINTEVERV